MTRLCTCDRVRLGFAWAEGDCAFCWHWHHTPEARSLWGGDPAGVTPVARPAPSPADRYLAPPCVHRGPETGEVTHCTTCTGRHPIRLRSCAAHGRCHTTSLTTDRATRCMGCGDREEPAAGPRMVMPADHRPGIYLGGILQIHVTRACDRACYGCTQGSNLAGRVEFMPPDLFRAACESLRDYFGVVGIFGGNPCLHPRFDELCAILRDVIPWRRRGLWSNHPKGKGKVCAITFNPAFSNLNVHQSRDAHDEFARDWPECRPYLKGLDSDSRHAPPFVAMRDVVPDAADRDRLIQGCDINKNWSALVGVFRGQLRGWFCEIAGAQSMLHQDDPAYPDTGVPIEAGWWKQGQERFQHQILKHCHECGVPLRGRGELANNPDGAEQVSATHAGIYRPKRPGRRVEVVADLIQLGTPLTRATDYIENGGIR